MPLEITPVTSSTEHWSTWLFCFRRPPYCCALANIRLVQHQLWFSRREVGLRPLWHHKGLLCTHSTLPVFVPLTTAPQGCLCFLLFQDTEKIQRGRYCGWAVNRGLITLFNGDIGVFVWIRWQKDVQVWFSPYLYCLSCPSWSIYPWSVSVGSGRGRRLMTGLTQRLPTTNTDILEFTVNLEANLKTLELLTTQKSIQSQIFLLLWLHTDEKLLFGTSRLLPNQE